jgi:hypothetical protein
MAPHRYDSSALRTRRHALPTREDIHKRLHRDIESLAFVRLSYSVKAFHMAFGEAGNRPLQTNTPGRADDSVRGVVVVPGTSPGSSSTVVGPSVSYEAHVHLRGARLRRRGRPRKRHTGDVPLIPTDAAAHAIPADPT